MFQSFEVKSNPADGPKRVAALRATFETLGVDGVLVPRADEHQGEYVPPSAARLAWLTGFTGSAGSALVLRERALLFVDGRYTVQGRAQTDKATFDIVNSVETSPAKWLGKHGQGLRIGIDPWLHTIDEVKALCETAASGGFAIVRLAQNAVDAIWPDRPAAPLKPVHIHPLQRAGKPAREKIADMAASLAEARADAAVLTDPSSIAWTFNIRGSDVEHTPLPLAFAIVNREGLPDLFIDKRKLGIKTEAYLTQLAELRAPATLEKHLAALASEARTVLLDPALVADRLREIVESNGGKSVLKPDPARLPRAVKNETELDGARAAHRRDGVAMCRFLAWLDAQVPGTVDEIAAATKLEEIRVTTGEEFQMPLKEISFETISAAGPNAALPHYRVSTQSNRTLQAGEVYLVDSGGQYEDGTTDITRTVAIGDVPEAVRRRFTLVLKGMIAICTARFPAGTRGIDLDPFARRALWQAGYDFQHGTGHGVGSYLSVHEGPQSISRRGMHELKPGMILSDEPGFYQEGSHGIRIENLIVVTEPTPIEGGTQPMLGFETLTLCPIDPRMIVSDLLSPDERDWLDAYHARVRAELAPLVGDEVRAWLEAATGEVGQ